MKRNIDKTVHSASGTHIWHFGKAMYGRVARCLLMALGIALLPLSASAAVISFTPTLVGGNQWTYDYTVGANPGDPTINEFTVWFDQSLYANLAVATSPVGWSPLAVQPDPSIPADGFFDVLALISGIGPGTSLSGFDVSFDYLGTGTPGTQSFDIVDPNNFTTLSSGYTSPALAPTNVPEPNTLALAAIGLPLLLMRRRHFPKT